MAVWFYIKVIIPVIIAVVLLSPDAQQAACTIPLLGYWDLTPFTKAMGFALIRCVGRNAEARIRRDFPNKREGFLRPAEIPKEEWSWEKFVEVSDHFRKPVLVKGLASESECLTWSEDQMRAMYKTDDETKEKFHLTDHNVNVRNLTQIEELSSLLIPPMTIESLKFGSFLDKITEHEPLYMSFDYRMLLDFPEMANMLNMSEYVPDEYSEMSLRNFFLSNYQDDVLASSFHGAINYNWFFQCRGNKRWWVVDRDLISYLGVFVHSIILLPSVRDEKLLMNHLPLYMADTNEGDMLFTPAFWMHAVATGPGLSMAVANRKFMHQQALFTNPYHYLLAGIQFPLMVARIITQKARKGIPYTLSALKFMEHETGRSEGVGLFQHLGITDHDWTIS